MGTAAALQRVRTARARLVLMMLHKNERTFVQLACYRAPAATLIISETSIYLMVLLLMENIITTEMMPMLLYIELELKYMQMYTMNIEDELVRQHLHVPAPTFIASDLSTYLMALLLMMNNIAIEISILLRYREHDDEDDDNRGL